MKRTINNEANHRPAKPEFLVIYSHAGGIKSPACHQIITLVELHQKLLTKYRAKTEFLKELWIPRTCNTNKERLRQHELIESTFPSVVLGVIFDKAADAADEEKEEYNESAERQKLSGLIVLSFKYRYIEGNKKRTEANRRQLQTQLLADLLLGPSIECMFKVPSQCEIIVLVAAGDMKSYMARVTTIVKYILAACPKLRPRLFGGDTLANERHIIGFDPLAYLRPRSAEGYIIFPVKQAQTATLEGEQRRKELACKRREARNKKR